VSLALEIIALIGLGASLGLALFLGVWALLALVWGVSIDG
jgi:hypothetical protein